MGPRPSLASVLAALLCSAGWLAAAPPAIRINRCAVTPGVAAPGQPVTLSVAATGTGVSCLNFRLRTPYRAGTGDVPSGFAVEPVSGFAVFADDARGHLLDNGRFDRDSAAGALQVELALTGLAPGLHYLTVFAHNRPGDASAQVMDYRNLELTVTLAGVQVRVLEPTAAVAEPVEFTPPPPVRSGTTPLLCGVRWRPGHSGSLALRLRCPYTWGRAEVLPGFAYDETTRAGYLHDGPGHLLRDQSPQDADPAPGSVAARLDPAGWPPGVHCLTVEVEAEALRLPYSAARPLYRDFQVRVPGPHDGLNVTVGTPVTVGPGTHFSALTVAGAGRVTTGTHFSDDGGATWTAVPARSMPRPNRLRDGSLVAFSYTTEPVPGQPGLYRGQCYRSTDGGTTVAGPTEALFAVADADAALGHAAHAGPLVGRSVVELDDGTLLAGMYGWFKQDTEPDRYRQGGRMRRAYVCASADGGASWRYLSTIAYEPFLGNEGYSEVVIRRLPSGAILAVIRTGGNNTAGWQDNPLVVSRSIDGGRSWSPVARTGVEGVWPDLAVMSDGTLVCSTGRPGALIMFSRDDGVTWTDHTPIDPERYSGYTAVCEVSPGRLLVGYGVQNGLDPAGGRRGDWLRVVPVTVRPRAAPPAVRPP